MKNLLTATVLLLSFAANSQYYYNDIEGTRALGERMRVYLSQKVKLVTAVGVDATGAKSPDFNERQEVDAGSRTLRIASRNGLDIVRQSYRFDEQGRLVTLTDSSGSIGSTSSYAYDNSNNLLSITTVVRDSMNDFNETELHQWSYSSNGKPERMWRIVNQRDSTEYRFTTDEKGNVADEQLFRRDMGFDKVYYYYDDEHHITDIVRYDKKLKKLLPDFMFEYDESGRVIQKITTISTASRNYLIWRFIYNEKGLKTKEALFNKQKELTGRIEYAYTF